MKLYLVSLPETKVSRRGRVPGWNSIYPNGAMTDAIIKIALSLEGHDIRAVYSADNHSQLAKVLATALAVGKRITSKLRGFNPGRKTGHKHKEVDKGINRLIERWDKGGPKIPFPEGDSWMSYERRFVATINRLLDDKPDESAVVLLEPREIAVVRAVVSGYDRDAQMEQLLSANHAQRERVYVVRKIKDGVKEPGHADSNAVDAGSERSKPIDGTVPIS